MWLILFSLGSNHCYWFPLLLPNLTLKSLYKLVATPDDVSLVSWVGPPGVLELIVWSYLALYFVLAVIPVMPILVSNSVDWIDYWYTVVQSFDAQSFDALCEWSTDAVNNSSIWRLLCLTSFWIELPNAWNLYLDYLPENNSFKLIGLIVSWSMRELS